MQQTLSIPQLTPSRLHKRRSTFFSLVVLTTLAGVWLLADYLRWTSNQLHGIEWAMLAVFTPLFYQLATGFWLAIIGLYVGRKRNTDPLNLMNSVRPEDDDKPLDGTTAIIMPVYNEEVTRVFEGLRVIYKSLEKTGQLKNYDFFVLSD